MVLPSGLTAVGPNKANMSRLSLRIDRDRPPFVQALPPLLIIWVPSALKATRWHSLTEPVMGCPIGCTGLGIVHPDCLVVRTDRQCFPSGLNASSLPRSPVSVTSTMGRPSRFGDSQLRRPAACLRDVVHVAHRRDMPAVMLNTTPTT